MLLEVTLALTLFSIIASMIVAGQWGIEENFKSSIKQIYIQNISKDFLYKWFWGNDSGFVSGSVPGVKYESRKRSINQCFDEVIFESSWLNGRQSTTTSVFSLVDFSLSEAQKFGGDCGSFPPKNFIGPWQVVETIDLGYSVVSVDVVSEEIVLALSSDLETDPDLAIISISNTNDVRYLDFGSRINSLDSATGYVFAAQHSTTTQLVTLRYEGHDDSFSTSTLPNVSGSRPEGFSIFYYDNRVFIGTKRTAGHEFHIFDVSVPDAPVWLGSREMNHNINDIEVRDGLAFLATSGNIRDLIVLNIRDPRHIVSVAEVDLPGNEDGRSVHVVESLVFLGRHRAQSPGHDEINIIEYEIDADGFFDANLLASAQTGGDVLSIKYFFGTLIVGTANPIKGLQGFRFENNNLRNLFAMEFEQVVTDIDYENEYLVVGHGTKLTILKQD